MSDQEIEILHPEREITIAGETVTVREFAFIEAMRLGPLVRPILAELHALIGDAEAEADVSLDLVAQAFEYHMDEFESLLAASCGRSREWIAGLSDDDGYRLTLTFWTVNSGFFARRLMVQAASRLPIRRTAEGEPSPTARSTPH